MKEPSRVRLNLNSNIVRAFLGEYKLRFGIPCYIPLDEKQRGNFEAWAITESKRRNIDIFGHDEYLKSVIAANAKIMSEGK